MSKITLHLFHCGDLWKGLCVHKNENPKKLIIILFILGLIVLTILLGKINRSVQFDKEVEELFAQSECISDQTFHKKQLESLPEPVQRYFNHILKEGQPYISFARIKHKGQFRADPNKGWMKIKGEQYAATGKPGFIWKGTTAMYTAVDKYIGNKGQLIVSLFSMFKIIDAKGEQYNQGELLRWLGESILYPTNLLPNERLQWFPIDTQTAKLTYSYGGLSLYFKITFNETGEVTEMETERYMDKDNLETWIIKTTDYREVNNVIIPTAYNVLWRLGKGDFSYAKFNITEIEYNKPEKF